MKRCTGCGREYDDSAGFCSYCGIPLELLVNSQYMMQENVHEQTANTNVNQTEELCGDAVKNTARNVKKGNKKAIIGVIAGLIAAAIIFALLVVFDVIQIGGNKKTDSKSDDSKENVEYVDNDATEKPTTEKPTTETVVTEKPTTEEITATEVVEEVDDIGLPMPDENGEIIYVYSSNDEVGMLIDEHFRSKYPQYSDLIKFVKVESIMTSPEYLTEIEGYFSGDQVPSIIVNDEINVHDYYTFDKYVSMYDIGITDDMYKNAYRYTKEMGTYENELMAMAFHACPGCFVYDADIAIEVFGTDDPLVVQEYVKDWETLIETAALLKEKGYYTIDYMPNENDALYRKFHLSTEQLMTITNEGYAPDYGQWSDKWSEFPDDVFGYFGCSWFLKSTINMSVPEGKRVCQGPEDYYWGGSFLGVTNECPNKELAALLIYTLCCDADVSYDMGIYSNQYPNNSYAVQQLYDNGEWELDVLDGQSPLLILDDVAHDIKID